MKHKFLSNFFQEPGQGKTIFFGVLTIALVPFLTASIISYLTTSNILKKDAVQFLESVSRLKSDYINSFFTERIKGLNHISQSKSNTDGFKNIMAEREIGKKESNESLAAFLNSFIYDVYTIGIRLELENFIATFQYKDIFILDLAGNIMVTLNDRTMLGINIFESKYAKTKLAKACKEVLETGKPRFSDLETGFDPVGIEASGYLVQMMIDEEDVKDPNTGQLKRDPDTGEIIKVPVRVGIMAIRIPVEQINEIMMKKMGAYNTGKTYLIGSDRLMRSGSPSDLLKTRVDTRGAERWENKQPGISMYKNDQGEQVLGVNYNLDSLERMGVSWGIIAEINESEAFGSVRNLRFIIVVISFFTIIIVILFSIIFTRRIVEPVRKPSD